METSARYLMENSVAQRLVTALKDSGISFVSYLPETRLSRMIPLLQKDSSFRVVPTTSESEAVSIAAGAALTGNQAAVYMEGIGVYVSAYSLFAVGERFGVPMLLLVSYASSCRSLRRRRWAPRRWRAIVAGARGRHRSLSSPGRTLCRRVLRNPERSVGAGEV